ncbi:MAG: amino acid deaminase/aldolase, partial [Polyangia bacterium]
MAVAAEAWARYRRALSGETLPAAFVDLDAFDANVDRLLAPARAAQKRVRVASKSLRCPALVGRVAARGDGVVDGVMTYSAGETAYLAGEGAARAAGTRVPVVIDVDMSWRPFGGLHVGVRRSPLRAPADVVALAQRIAAAPSLRFEGIMGYEAQIAGVPDAAPFAAWQNPLKRALKRASRPDVAGTRAAVVEALRAAQLPPAIVNGGGTGSADWSSSDAALTEITVGSGFLVGHLFDHYAGLALAPALFFALQATRRPTAGIVTCHGGGWVASGPAGRDRLPEVVFPAGSHLLPLEGAGEVQTPVALPSGAKVALGDPLFFRPAKSGELAEHFDEYLLVRGDRIEARARTYRGLGRRF